MKKLSQFSGCLVAGMLAMMVLSGCRSTPPPSFGSAVDFGNDPLLANQPAALPGTAAAGSTNAAPGKGVTIKPEDSISISFVDPMGTVIAPFTGRVSEEGTVTLPLIGAVKAAGRTAAELQKDIHDAYVPKYYLRMTVTVQGQERFYYVGGEVKAPNRYLWVGEITLTKAIQTASDFTDWAQKKKVTITRADGKAVGPINCVRVLEGKDPDVPIFPGDKVYVPRRGF
jgi:polysaccharide export outer membrane protein